MQVIFLFQNTRSVILAEKVLLDAELRILVIPVPKMFSSECGMALSLLDANSKEKAENLLKDKKIGFQTAFLTNP